VKSLGPIHIFLIVIVAAVWVWTFSPAGHSLTEAQRQGAQWAMILLLGAVFGVGFLKKGNGK